MRSALLLLALSCSVSATFAQGARPSLLPARPQQNPAQSNWQAAERAKLIAGVGALPKLGAPGPIALWGATAFPVVGSPAEGKGEVALAGAAGFEKGRIFLFGHNSYIEPDQANDGPVATMLLNAAKWTTPKQKPRIGSNSARAIAFFESKGFPSKKLQGPITKQSLANFDVIVLNAQGATGDAEALALVDFIKAGGGLVAGMTGWAFEQTSGGKRLSSAHGINKALGTVAGIAFTDAGLGAKDKEFEIRPELSPLMNASAALNAIAAQDKGGPKLSPADFEQAASAIQLALAVQPPGKSPFQTAVIASLAGHGSAVPTEKTPLTAEKDSAARGRLGIETRILKLAPAADIKPHPSARAFPGTAPTSAPKVTRDVSINPAVPGWTSTGLWVNAGDPITVKIPPALAGKGFAVRIGCHSDSLYHLEQWKRAPEITRSIPLEAEVTPATSAFGGLLYIEVPKSAEGTAPFTVTIAGAIEAPLFALGRDDDAKWNSTIKHRPGPWAEFVCDKIILTCPTENARHVTNPTELMKFWTRVVDAQDEISNQARERKRPERIVCDVQISAGYMHSGYPIMVPVSTADEMITFGASKAPGWGFYHELGHNHQRGEFTFEGTGEVTNNVLGMYVFHYVLGRDPLTGHSAISPKKLDEHIKLIRRLGDKFTVWKQEPFVALTTYIQLIDGFGWDAWRAYLHSFADPEFGPVPRTDDEKRDQFLIRYSKIAKKNLSDFFAFWGIPVSPAAKAEVAKYERWMPKGPN